MSDCLYKYILNKLYINTFFLSSTYSNKNSTQMYLRRRPTALIQLYVQNYLRCHSSILRIYLYLSLVNIVKQ